MAVGLNSSNAPRRRCRRHRELLRARAAHHYTTDDLRIAHALAVQVAAVFQNARLFSAATRARDELNAVLESISDAVLVVDNTGTIVLLNAALIRMLNLPEQCGHRATSAEPVATRSSPRSGG